MVHKYIFMTKTASLIKFLKLYIYNQEMFLKDIRRKISPSSLYDSVWPKIEELNEEIRLDFPDLYFFVKRVKRNPVAGHEMEVIHRHSSVRIKERKNGCFVIIVLE